jgi:hypothetical protein
MFVERRLKFDSRSDSGKSGSNSISSHATARENLCKVNQEIVLGDHLFKARR